MKTLNCEQAAELFSPLIDGCIEPGEETMLRAHLESCPHCAGEYAAWQGISAVLRQAPKAACPAPDFSRSVINSIREQEQRRSIAGRVAGWKKQLAAAAAAVFILAGSLGINAGMKGFQLASGPDENQNSGYVATGGETGPNTVANNGGGTGSPEPVTPAPDPEPEPGDNGSKGNTGNTGGEEHEPGNNNPDRATNTNNNGANGGQNSGTSGNAAVAREPQPVLLASNMVIKSTVLKLAVNDTAQAMDRAEEIAAAAGSKTSYLGAQDTGSGTVELMRITVPKDAAVKLVNSLTGLGTVISRNDDDRNVTTQYNNLAARYNELVEGGGDDPEKAAEMESMNQQLDQWTADANAYTVVLWLQQK